MVYTSVYQQQETGHEAQQAFCIIGTVSHSWLESDLGHSPTFITEVKERVYIYFYSVFWAITAFSGVNLRFDSG
jgi:hypothetical protein